jgi:hypothetical protein
MTPPAITTSAGFIHVGTARMSITEAWDIMSLWADELRSDVTSGDHESASRTIKAIDDLAKAIIAAAEWLEARP